MSADLLAAWRAEETGQPDGWDFAGLAGRVTEPDLPWDFTRVCRQALEQATLAHPGGSGIPGGGAGHGAPAVLDMGTGGGEHLLRLRDLLPLDTTATEGWAPNVPVARAALEPHGITVVDFGQPDDDPDPAPMPFPDRRFDVILNRHESYHPAEVARVLRPGGVFLTQQVGGDEFGEVRQALAHPPSAPHVRYDQFRSALTDAGLEVTDGAESVDHYVFADIAALVAYVQLVPWDVPEDFSVDRYAEALLALHQRGPGHGEPLRVSRKRFWLRAMHRRT